MKLHSLPRQVPKAKLSSKHWVPADLSWPGAFKPASPRWKHSGLRHESLHWTSPWHLFIQLHVLGHSFFSWICKTRAFWNSLSFSPNCQKFALPFLSLFWDENTDYVKGPLFVTWYPNFTPKKPMDNISLFIIIPNTNEFSQGQLGLLAKKAELT